MSILSIHQPNFFPWLGLFHKIKASSTYYVFDHVAVTMGKGRHSRTKILLNGEEHWLTASIKTSGRAGQRYCDIEVQGEKVLIRKHLGTIRQAYIKAPYFKEIYGDLEELYSTMESNLCNFNINCIKLICSKIDISCEFVRTSELLQKYQDLDLKSGNDLVLSLSKISGCKTYISGTGCLDFIRPETFTANGIDFRFQTYTNTPYPQQGRNHFAAGLSIIDAAMNLGWSGVSHLLTSNNN
jgi:hypothetical protein